MRYGSGPAVVAGKGKLKQSLDKLEAALGTSSYIVGHNILRHDIEHLLAARPRLRAKMMAPIDTLWLNPFPFEREEDPDLINAGKQTITELPQTAFFDSAQSFAMIRGGKIAMAILGAMEVAENGDLANWMIPGKLVKGMGGAMDLVAGVGRVVVVMDHTSKHGESKVLKSCTLPLTGQGMVNRIITNLGVLDVVPGGLKLIELADGVTEADLRAATEATLVE